jgi:hypothetical protein
MAMIAVAPKPEAPLVELPESAPDGSCRVRCATRYTRSSLATHFTPAKIGDVFAVVSAGMPGGSRQWPHMPPGLPRRTKGLACEAQHVQSAQRRCQQLKLAASAKCFPNSLRHGRSRRTPEPPHDYGGRQ